MRKNTDAGLPYGKKKMLAKNILIISHKIQNNTSLVSDPDFFKHRFSRFHIKNNHNDSQKKSDFL